MLIRGALLAALGIAAPTVYLSDAGYAALGVIVSALITTAGAVLVAYITVSTQRRNRDDAAYEDRHLDHRDDHPDDRDTSREKSP